MSFVEPSEQNYLFELTFSESIYFGFNFCDVSHGKLRLLVGLFVLGYDDIITSNAVLADIV